MLKSRLFIQSLSQGRARVPTPPAPVLALFSTRLLATNSSEQDPDKTKQEMKDTEDLAWPRDSNDNLVSRKTVEVIGSQPAE